MALKQDDYRILRLLKFAPLERRRRGGWRFGTRRIEDHVVDRLVEAGRARRDGDLVHLERQR